MCDDRMLARWAKEGLSRRQFGALGTMAAVAACSATGSKADAGDAVTADLVEQPVSFATPDGTLDGFFVHPASGRHPGVVLWPDIAGLREAKRQMARRLAGEGYAVLVANPYYRDVAGEQFKDFADFINSGGFQKVGPWRGRFTTATITTDNSACADWLAGQSAVDGGRKMGVQGYCMTGSFAVLGPHASARIGAGASFHGGGLVREGEDSPHRLLRQGAQYLIAIAQNDDAKAPEDKVALRTAADAAGATAEIEVYPADHGWCVLDSPVYSEAAAEKAWARLLATYQAAL